MTIFSVGTMKKYSLVYFSTFNSFSIVPNIGVFPKWLLTLVGSAHTLMTLLSILVIPIGTLSTGPSFIVIVAVPLNTDVVLFGLEHL
jgi:hypothetical protein